MVNFKFQVGQTVLLTGNHEYAGFLAVVTERMMPLRSRRGEQNKYTVMPRYNLDLLDHPEEERTHSGEEYMREYADYGNVEDWLIESK